jgi:hypothetical protein
MWRCDIIIYFFALALFAWHSHKGCLSELDPELEMLFHPSRVDSNYDLRFSVGRVSVLLRPMGSAEWRALPVFVASNDRLLIDSATSVWPLLVLPAGTPGSWCAVCWVPSTQAAVLADRVTVTIVFNM